MTGPTALDHRPPPARMARGTLRSAMSDGWAVGPLGDTARAVAGAVRGLVDEFPRQVPAVAGVRAPSQVNVVKESAA